MNKNKARCVHMKIIKNIFISIIFFIGTPNLVYAIEIQCSLTDTFDDYAGSILFDYDEKNKLLEITKTSGDGADFMDHPRAWISEVKGKKLHDIANDSNSIWAKDNGNFNWEFKFNRQDGSLIVKQTKVKLSWKGSCRKVDRSNKF